MKISLKANRNYSENYSENFIVVDNEYNPLSPNSFGNFEISTILIKTSFSKSDENYSETFKNFQDNRLIIAQRLAALNGDSSGTVDEFGYPIGYGKNNQAVLIPAFLSAYSGKNAENISLNAITILALSASIFLEMALANLFMVSILLKVTLTGIFFDLRELIISLLL